MGTESGMKKQMSFAQLEQAGKRKTTRREKFLGEMEKVVPWERLCAVIAPHYPKGAKGRPPIGLERMLRVYFLQQWYALADEALEDALYDSAALRAFAGIDLSAESVPDATTLLKFRHLLERHQLTAALFEEVNAMLRERKLLLFQGTMVDATIIAAPSSTKNRTGSRDPEMHQTKKGNAWRFGMKAHTGADRSSGIVHRVVCTAANVSDISQVAHLLHRQEEDIHADSGYLGAEQRPEVVAAGGSSHRKWYIALKRSRVQAIRDEGLRELSRKVERMKARIRARVEHPFHVIKNIFRHRKVRYRGLARNTAQIYSLFTLSNLYLSRRRLLQSA